MPPSVAVSLPPYADSVREAQDAVREFCDAHDLAGLRDVAELLASELVTNAVLHARSDIELRIALRPARLRVEVCDLVPRPVELRPTAPDDLSGRGLGLLVALAGWWGVETSSAGKVVWFEMPA